MDRHSVRARRREALEVVLGLDDHQMHIDRQLGELAHGFDYLGAEGEIRNEAAVHDIDVNPVGTALLEHRDLVGELGKVGAQDRWRDSNAHSGSGSAKGGGGGALVPVSILIEGGGGKCETV